MNISISTRKTTVKDAFREKVGKKLKKFDRFFDDEANAAVLVTNERDRETVEITVTYNGMIFRAEKTASDRMEALETVTDVLFKQIVKNKSKLETRVRAKAFDGLNAEEISYSTTGDDSFEVVRLKKFPIHPMPLDEAILQMNMLGHTFFVFENAHTGDVNVVYRRNNGDYGLIEPIR
jgi:putative sigma-54 modulation protein